MVSQWVTIQALDFIEFWHSCVVTVLVNNLQLNPYTVIAVFFFSWFVWIQDSSYVSIFCFGSCKSAHFPTSKFLCEESTALMLIVLHCVSVQSKGIIYLYTQTIGRMFRVSELSHTRWWYGPGLDGSGKEYSPDTSPLTLERQGLCLTVLQENPRSQ